MRQFEHLTDQDLGWQIVIAKQYWPTDPQLIRLRIEYIAELYEELYIRWACADDSPHRQGQRM